MALGGIGTPENIAHAAVYRVSDASGYAMDEVLKVNGGAYFG